MVAYVDESLAAGIGDTMHKAEQYLLETLRLYFHRCDVFNLKLKITKCEFWMKQLEWCGHLISEKGISIAPSKLKTLNAVPTPVTGDQLMQYICALNFLRNKIPMYNEVMAPLRSMLQEVLKKTTRNTKAQASKVLLTDVGWRGHPDGYHDQAFEESKEALKKAVTLARYDDRTHTLCLLTGASSSHFGSILTAIPDEDIHARFEDQRHSPIELLSGSFKQGSAPYNWPINQKSFSA